ncbi:SelT/SelW/SelH family protein [bacterium]|nr:SelT/SelW/SelH family protein [bacterium]
MAAVIKTMLNLEPKLIQGSQGIFDVAIDGEIVFSKYSQGRFPEDSEILDAIKRSMKT